MSTPTDETLTPREVEARYGVRMQTLAWRRSQGMGPAYTKTALGWIHYRRADIEAWLASR